MAIGSSQKSFFCVFSDQRDLIFRYLYNLDLGRHNHDLKSSRFDLACKFLISSIEDERINFLENLIGNFNWYLLGNLFVLKKDSQS